MAARQIVVDLIGDSKKFTKATDEAVKASEGMVSKLKKAGSDIKGGFLEGIGIGGGLGMFDAVSGAVSSVVSKIGQSIELASDKAESASKANVLFGKSYGIVEAASRNAATTVAMSSGAYLDAAGNVGNLLINMGIASDEAAGMSTDMLQLAADMGSFSNADPTEVVEAMGAAFRGESDPIQRFGVFLSAAKVEAKALAMGLKQGKGPLSDQAKAMATYQIILEQTTNAQGDFARTADGMANSQRIAAAKQEEAMTRLGEKLMPLAAKIMPMLADATTMAIDAFTGLADVLAPLVDGALSAISGAIDAIGESYSALRDLLDPAGAEWNEVTREIVKQAKALGIDEQAVLAFVAAEEKRAKVEAERQRQAAAVAAIDKQIADVTANATAEIDGYVEAVKAGGNADQFNNIIMERKLQLNTQLEPLMRERNRLLGIQEQALAEANKAEDASVTVTGKATAAVAAYTKAQEALKKAQAGVEAMYPPLVKATEGASEVFSRAASAANLSFGSVLLAAQEAQKGTTKAVAKVGKAVEVTFRDMFTTMDDARGPWKEAWQRLAAWAKDPFSPDKFEKWLGSRVKRAMANARDAFGAERQRWLRIASAYRWIMKNNWIDPTVADLELIISTMRLADRIAKVGNSNAGGGKAPGRNAAGTSNWRGGWTWLGEQGPELVNLPRGSSVMSNQQSVRAASGGGSTYNITVNVAPGGDLVQTGKQIVAAISQYERRSGKAWRTA